MLRHFAVSIGVLETSPDSLREAVRWREVDLESATWVVPATRLRSRKEHRVPLSRAALVVLKRADGLRGRGLVLPWHSGEDGWCGRARSVAEGPQDRLQPARVPQFLRSWCSEEGIDRELAEQALTHAVGSQVELCYARSDVLDRRREVMEA